MPRANPIDEKQRPETKLIKRSFLLNNRMKIIILLCLFQDRGGGIGIIVWFITFMLPFQTI